MSDIAIVTDSVASIPERLLKELNIHWVPFYIHRGQEVLRDLVTIQRDAFYQWILTARELPKTACPGPGDYYELYESLAAQGVEEIVSIHMTSKGSGAYQSAIDARDMIAESSPRLRIEVMDTLNVSMCHGWIVIEAARTALAGKPVNQVVEKIQSMIPVTRMIQTADTLRYLYLGGRIGRAKHLLGSLLRIKPLIGMENGEIVALGRAHSQGEAHQAITRLVEKAVGYKGRIKAAYMHAAAQADVLKLKAMIEERMTVVESYVCELSPALGVHSGPGTTGLCYYPLQD